MDRKKTILIAVLINAGLLVLLFVVALHHEEPSSKSVDMAQTVSPQESQPLFNDAAPLADAPLAQAPDAALQPELAQPGAPLAAQLPSQPAAPNAPAEIVHQLPPLAAQESPAPIAPVNVPIASPAPQLTDVKVKRGDSLEKIAKAHRTTVDEIIRLNQLPSTFLRVGQTLKLPAAHGAAAKSKTVVSADRPATNQAEYYVVKVGDNPWTIAMKHHMRVDQLLKINNLNEEKARRLKAGDRLRVR